MPPFSPPLGVLGVTRVARMGGAQAIAASGLRHEARVSRRENLWAGKPFCYRSQATRQHRLRDRSARGANRSDCPGLNRQRTLDRADLLAQAEHAPDAGSYLGDDFNQPRAASANRKWRGQLTTIAANGTPAQVSIKRTSAILARDVPPSRLRIRKSLRGPEHLSFANQRGSALEEDSRHGAAVFPRFLGRATAWRLRQPKQPCTPYGAVGFTQKR